MVREAQKPRSWAHSYKAAEVGFSGNQFTIEPELLTTNPHSGFSFFTFCSFIHPLGSNLWCAYYPGLWREGTGETSPCESAERKASVPTGTPGGDCPGSSSTLSSLEAQTRMPISPLHCSSYLKVCRCWTGLEFDPCEGGGGSQQDLLQGLETLESSGSGTVQP